MKAGMEHRVPLSRQAVDVLDAGYVWRDETGLVFPSVQKPGKPMSDMTLMKILRTVGLAEHTTAHEFRSSFKNRTLEL